MELEILALQTVIASRITVKMIFVPVLVSVILVLMRQRMPHLLFVPLICIAKTK
jgi:hypothetical protein